jgi:clan AA aspartic protease (TIGR02281 family)
MRQAVGMATGRPSLRAPLTPTASSRSKPAHTGIISPAPKSRFDALVDSGASILALTYDGARRAGLFVRDSDYTQRVSTANGLARAAPVVIDRISLGAIAVRNVPAR